jgi:hypothetical protein
MAVDRAFILGRFEPDDGHTVGRRSTATNSLSDPTGPIGLDRHPRTVPRTSHLPRCLTADRAGQGDRSGAVVAHVGHSSSAAA